MTEYNIDKQARVHNKPWLMNSHKGSLMEDVPNIISVFLLVRFTASYGPKIRLIACLVEEIDMKKTLKLGF